MIVQDEICGVPVQTVVTLHRQPSCVASPKELTFKVALYALPIQQFHLSGTIWLFMIIHNNLKFGCLCLCKFAKKYPEGYRGRRPRRWQDLVHTSLHVQHVLRGLSRQDRSWLFDNIPSSFKSHSVPAGTVGVDFSTALLDLPGGTRVRLQLWDIAGQERFTWMTRVYYREVMFRPNRAIVNFGLS